MTYWTKKGVVKVWQRQVESDELSLEEFLVLVEDLGFELTDVHRAWVHSLD